MKFYGLLIAAFAAMQSIGQANSEEVPAFYNPNETVGSFDMIMKPYPIPVEITTYVDFFFNLPDDLPEFFHIVMGEVINSQPLHLHHFVLTGCSEKVDQDIEGAAIEFNRDEIPSCTIPLGGWAPGGNVFSNIDLDTGVLMGRGLGVQALQLNVHYTDGALDPETQTFKMATDGIRVHYTSDFRPYTSTTKPLINIGSATPQLFIPSGESRFFVTKTCKVNTSCKDISSETLQRITSFIGGGAQEGRTCPDIKAFCNIGGQFGSYIQQLCPETCGFCGDVQGGVNPLNPGSYRATGVNYHAHLLGREMYTTLLREETPDATVALQKSSSTSEMMVKDMKSKEFWIYDFQETFALDFEDMVSSDGTNTILRGTEIKPGDKIQVSCVYDSTYRDKSTIFGLSTYDEMCITGVVVTFETPASLLNPDAANTTNIDTRAELNLLSFSCDADEETDIYTGVLADGEDGTEIWKNHPISAAEGCTFPADEFSLGVFQTRNCPVDDNDFAGICQGLSREVTLLDDAIAGASCAGGRYSERDSNDGVTKEECLKGGGQWNPYTCSDITFWLRYQAQSIGLTSETIEYLVENWWQPKCCSDESSSEDFFGDEEDSGASAGIAKGTMTLALMSAMAGILF